jgi:Leucine-rich repeat (LRR) protein
MSITKAKQIISKTQENNSKLLDLSYLQLTSKDLENLDIVKLENLTELDLSKNQLSSVDCLKELKNLTMLDLSENQLSSVESLKGLKNLTMLDLRWNPELEKVIPMNILHSWDAQKIFEFLKRK